MANQKGPAAPADKVALYEAVIARFPTVARKGDTMPYTSVNGNMQSYLGKTGVLSLRLAPEAREAFLATYKTKLTEAYGIVQKEYVDVPDALLKKTAELAPHFAASLAYVSALRAKATTKAKAAGAKAKPAATKAKPKAAPKK